LAALDILRAEPERMTRLRRNAALLLDLLRAGGLDTGASVGAAIVPVVTGDSIRAGRLAQALFARGVNVQPILYPAVPQRAARLRFFATAAHSEAQLREAAAILIEEERALAAAPLDLAAAIRYFGQPR
jgi:7-keto-8-aminopelargonate synthetase-like enzyme